MQQNYNNKLPDKAIKVLECSTRCLSPDHFREPQSQKQIKTVLVVPISLSDRHHKYGTGKFQTGFLGLGFQVDRAACG